MQLTWGDVYMRAKDLADHLKRALPGQLKAYGVPRGGIYATMAVAHCHQYIELVEDPEEGDVFIDDIVDTGDTRKKCSVPFFSLVDKPEEGISEWVSFPWERMGGEIGGIETNITRILEFIGEDPHREGLIDTPKRVTKAYGEIFGGYKQNPEDVMTTFVEGACDEMVLLTDIEFYSCCEHHMQPFFGKAHIAYLPDKKVIGVSKLARLLDIFARRLQIQERLTSQVADALMEYLHPRGAAVLIEAQHFCMICRGVQKQNSRMITSSLRGAFKDDEKTRAEFMALVRGSNRQ